MFVVDAIGFWNDEPETVMVSMDLETLAKVVTVIGRLSPSTGLDDDLENFYHDACSKVFNRLYEDGVNECLED